MLVIFYLETWDFNSNETDVKTIIFVMSDVYKMLA